MDAIKAVFSSPKPKGPDPSILAAQRKQQARLDEREASEQKKLDARKNTVAAMQGRGGRKTLFDTELGVPSGETLGA